MTSRLGSRMKSAPPASESHARSMVLSDFILGSQDGLVNVLGVLLGVAVSSYLKYQARDLMDPFGIIMAGGLAAAFAESLSMGAVAYTSTLARRDHYLGELAREQREMKELPEAERQEVREIFQRWGFEGQELEDIVDRMISKPQAWLEFMMAHELRLAPLEDNQARKSAFLVGISALVGSLIPIVPFLILRNPEELPLTMVLSVSVAAVTLFAIGWYKGRTTIGHPYRSGVQMLVIGTVSAVAGFLIAWLVTGTPIG